MLDMIGYVGDNIRNKTIFEPSFGGGAFLLQIVDRIFDYADEHSLAEEEIIAILDNVHGVELDEKWYSNTKQLMIDVTNQHGLNYEWTNLICCDTTKIDINHTYDYAIMNPPLSINQQLCKKDRYTSINHKKQLHTHFYHGGVVVS
jgi:hypothetical protein